MYTIKRASTQSPLVFLLVQQSDHITGKTGAAPTVTISKNGGAFISPSGAVTEIANGWYAVAANATDTSTLGPLALHATASGADPCDIIVAQIVAYDPTDLANLGLSKLSSISFTLGNQVDVNVRSVNSIGVIGDGSDIPWGP